MIQMLILLRRFAPLALGGLMLLFTSNARWSNAAALIDPASFAFVLVLPWVALAVTDSVRGARITFTDGFLSVPANAPANRLADTRSRLRFVAGATVAAGVVGAIFGFVQELNALAMVEGNAEPGVWPRFAASMLLGPLYGVGLKSFLYDPTESALAAAGGELADIFE